jgi:hypothetical protein
MAVSDLVMYEGVEGPCTGQRTEPEGPFRGKGARLPKYATTAVEEYLPRQMDETALFDSAS